MTHAPSSRTTLHRLPARGDFDADTIAAIIDAAPIGHLGFVAPQGGHATVIPTLIARMGHEVIVHFSRIGRMADALRQGEVCLTVTVLDGLVLAKSAFHHSANYRSVVAFGRARELTSAEEKNSALWAFTEKLVPGRWDQVRAPTAKELAITAVFALSLTEASAKIRTGGPKDDEEDLALPVPVGVMPVRMVTDPLVVAD
jgi:nitroimidazol reductase NimA-like FMN-containing flavoprotein (pyridoxamine 5'-phosphate oxidase superfamily)